MFTLIRHLLLHLQDEAGQDLVEYGLLALLIAVVVAMGVSLLGMSVNEMFVTIGTVVQQNLTMLAS